MDPAQLDRVNHNWNVSLIVIVISIFVCSVFLVLRILTTLSLPKPTNVGDRRFTLAEWTMITAYVRILPSKVKLSQSNRIMRAGLGCCHLCFEPISLVTT